MLEWWLSLRSMRVFFHFENSLFPLRFRRFEFNLLRISLIRPRSYVLSIKSHMPPGKSGIQNPNRHPILAFPYIGPISNQSICSDRKIEQPADRKYPSRGPNKRNLLERTQTNTNLFPTLSFLYRPISVGRLVYYCT